MRSIYFSTAQPDHFKDTGLFLSGLLTPRLRNEEIHLSVEPIPWAKLWNFIQTRTIDEVALDVSEMGSTWVDSLADAGVLAEFSPDDITRIGGREVFTTAAWQSVASENDDRILSIPMLTDTRLIFYWRDMLADVHIREDDAFSSIEKLRQTLTALQSGGLPGWGAPTFGCSNTLHHVASWIWSEGGSFLSEDRSRTEFCEEKALSGMAAYFSLFAFMPRPFDSFAELTLAFKERRIAAVMDGPWLYAQLANGSKEIDIADIGVALPPGAPFLGGSNLILWKQAVKKDKDAAMTVIRHLISAEIQSTLCEAMGLLPVRKDVVLTGPYAALLKTEAVRSALETGRHMPRTHLWAPLETALIQALGLVWQNIKNNQHRLSVDILRRHLEPLAKRFDRMLKLF